MSRGMSRVIAFLLFLFFIGVGLFIARGKPLWVDELHTQYNVTQGTALSRLVLNGAPLEGNNAPLFYLVQKWVNIIPGTEISRQDYDDAILANARRQILLRLTANVFVALSLSLLFYFFASRSSVWLGVYAVMCALASPMIWLYWAEARPYSLLLFLTTMQCLLVIVIARAREFPARAWGWLGLVHALLAFTSYLSLIHIIAPAVLLLSVRGRRRLWKTVAGVFLLPAAVALFYYAHGLHEGYYGLFFQPRYLLDNVPLDRVAILVCIGLFLGCGALFSRISVMEKGCLRYAGFAGAALLGVVAFFAVVKFREDPAGALIGLHSRFFIFLTPIGIVFQTLCVGTLVRSLGRGVRARYALVFIIVLLLVIGLMNTGKKVLKSKAFFWRMEALQNKVMLERVNLHIPDFRVLATAMSAENPSKDVLEGCAQYHRYIVEAVPGRFDAWLAKGLCEYRLGDLPSAELSFQKAAALEPDSFWAWYDLGMLYFNNRLYDASDNVLRRALFLSQGYETRSLLRSRVFVDILRADDHADPPNSFLAAVESVRKAVAIGCLFRRDAACVRQNTGIIDGLLEQATDRGEAPAYFFAEQKFSLGIY